MTFGHGVTLPHRGARALARDRHQRAALDSHSPDSASHELPDVRARRAGPSVDTSALWPAERSASGDYRRRERETPDDIEVALVMTASGLASGRTARADQRHRGRDRESPTGAGRRDMMMPADDCRRANLGNG
jgi:hypothetical protein